MVINPWTLPWPEPLVAASPSELRATFNAAGYNGPDGIPSDIESTVFRSGTPKPEHEQIPGTRFEMVLYRRAGAPIAIVHQYVRPDGRLGGSGRRDPKRVIVAGDGTLTIRRS